MITGLSAVKNLKIFSVLGVAEELTAAKYCPPLENLISLQFLMLLISL